MLTVLLILAHEASATPNATVLLPEAAIPEAPTARAGVLAFTSYAQTCVNVVAGGCGRDAYVAGGPVLGADMPLGDHVALDVQAAGAWTGDALLTGASASARYRAVRREDLVITPWTVVYGLPQVPAAVGAIGVAIDTGGRSVRLDASVPVLAGSLSADGFGDFPVWVPPLLSEVGVRFQVNEQHAFRVGTLSFVPNVGWQGTFGATRVEALVTGTEEALGTRVQVERAF